MCLAKAYLRDDDGDHLLLENVAEVTALGDRLILTSILRDAKELQGRIANVDFANSLLILERQAVASGQNATDRG